MEMSSVNWLAVVAATIAMMALGAVWFSPVLFMNAWKDANRFTDEDLQGGSPGKAMGIAAVISFVMAANLAMFLAGPETDVVWGMTAGFLAGFGWAALSLAMVALFEMRPFKYMLVNGAYLTVGFTIMGAILGAWR